MTGIPILANLYIVLSILTILFIFWAFMLADCLKRPEYNFHTEMKNAKFLWTLLIIVGVPWCAIIYFVSVKRKD